MFKKFRKLMRNLPLIFALASLIDQMVESPKEITQFDVSIGTDMTMDLLRQFVPAMEKIDTSEITAELVQTGFRIKELLEGGLRI